MAAPEIISQRLPQMEIDKISQRELRLLLEGIVDGLRAVTLKLDADVGVTDTNYTATLDAIVKKS